MGQTDLSSVSVELADGQLGISGADSSSAAAFIGTCSGGTVEQVEAFAGSDTDTVNTVLGAGDMPDVVGDFLLSSQGKTAYAIKGTGSTDGSASAAELVSGTGPTVPTFSGRPDEDAEFLCEIVTTGTQATATWRPSLDGGDTWGETRLAGAGLSLGQGTMQITFPAGTYTAGALFSSTFTGPRNTLADVTDAADAFIESPYRAKFIHVLGAPANAADLATMMAALDAKADAAALVGKMLVFVLEAPAVDPALLVTATQSVVAPNVVVTGGYAQVFDQNDRLVEKWPNARKIAGRLGRNPLSVSLMRSADDSKLDPIYPDAKAIVPNGSLGTGADGYIDSRKLPALNNARFTTVQSIPGRGGAYVAHSFTFAALTSDFLKLPNRLIGNRGKEVLFDAMWDRAQQRVPRNATTGFIDETYAKTFERDAKSLLRTALVEEGHATAVSVVMNRNDNLVNDPTLRIKARAVHVTQAGAIDVSFGLAVAI
jgi:hypothetical protein